MSEQTPPLFRAPEQELEHLGRQLAEIRESLRKISARVGLIERHVKRAFAVSCLPGQPEVGSRRSRFKASAAPSFPPEQVRPIFDDLVQTWRQGNQAAA